MNAIPKPAADLLQHLRDTDADYTGSFRALAAMATGTAAPPSSSRSARARSWPRSPGGPGTSPAAAASAATRCSTGSAAKS